MLYYLLYQLLEKYFSPLNVFRYITVRTAYASLTALFLSLVLGPGVIRKLRELQIGQVIREEGPERHQTKAGTPTMGGVLIVLATTIPTLLWADLTNAFVLIALFSMLGFAAVGFADDYSKLAQRHSRGMSGRTKLFLQVMVSFGAGTGLVVIAPLRAYSTQLVVPVLQRFHPHLGIYLLGRHHYFFP